MITLRVTKKMGFSLTLENRFGENHKGVKLTPSSVFLGLKN